MSTLKYISYTSLGVGMTAVGAAVLYVGMTVNAAFHGAIDQGKVLLNEGKVLLEKSEGVVTEMKGVIKTAEETGGKLKQQAVILRNNLSGIGQDIGDAGGAAVQKFNNVVQCAEDDTGCQEGLRGKIGNWLPKRQPE